MSGAGSLFRRARGTGEDGGSRYPRLFTPLSEPPQKRKLPLIVSAFAIAYGMIFAMLAWLIWGGVAAGWPLALCQH
jgi:hypothetical protein